MKVLLIRKRLTMNSLLFLRVSNSILQNITNVFHKSSPIILQFNNFTRKAETTGRTFQSIKESLFEGTVTPLSKNTISKRNNPRSYSSRRRLTSFVVRSLAFSWTLKSQHRAG